MNRKSSCDDDRVREAANAQSSAGEAKVIALDAPMLSQIARQEYNARRRRVRHLDQSLLGEPAWDILLDLFVNAVEERPVSVTSSAIASQVPQTTALRYFATLEREGLIARQKSKTDARVTFLRLTDEGYLRMVSCLRERIQSVLGSN